MVTADNVDELLQGGIYIVDLNTKGTLPWQSYGLLFVRRATTWIYQDIYYTSADKAWHYQRKKINDDPWTKWFSYVTDTDLGLNIKFGDGYVQVGADNNTSCRLYFDASVRMVSHQNGENYENNFRATSLCNIPIFETFIPTFNNTDTVAITLQHKVIDGGHIFVTNGDFAACPVPIVGIRLPDGDRTNKVEVRFASNIVGVARINILYKPYYF